MNWFIGIWLVLAFIIGWKKGLVMALFGLAGWLIGLFLAFKCSAQLGSWLAERSGETGPWIPAISFFLILIGVGIAVRLLGKLVEGALQLAMLGWLNRLIGGIIYSLLALLLLLGVLHFLISWEMVEPLKNGPWRTAQEKFQKWTEIFGNWQPQQKEAGKNLQ